MADGYIIGVANQKGGAGKTTTICSLADDLYSRDADVLVIDLDPQGSAVIWSNVAEDLDVSHPTVIQMGEGWHKKVEPFREAYDYILVDPPAKLEAPQRAVFMACDLVILPTQAHSTDIWALGETLDTADVALEYRPDLQAHILLTRVDSRTKVATRAAELLKSEEIELPVLKSTLGDRVDFNYSLSRGLGPVRFKPDSAAAAEVSSLTDELLSILRGAK